MKIYSGIVTPGHGRAGKLGFPTINIPSTDESLSGIYAGKVYVGGKEYIAAVFADPRRAILEAHLIGFSGDLYGTEAAFELHEKLRESAPYTNDEELKAAIAEDVRQVEEYFTKR